MYVYDLVCVCLCVNMRVYMCVNMHVCERDRKKEKREIVWVCVRKSTCVRMCTCERMGECNCLHDYVFV